MRINQFFARECDFHVVNMVKGYYLVEVLVVKKCDQIISESLFNDRGGPFRNST